MIGWAGFVVVALASYRAARIVATDTISDAFRDRVYRFAWADPDDPRYLDLGPAPGEAHVVGDRILPKPVAPWRTYVYGLVSCPLCIGVWIAAAFYVAWRWWDWMPVRALLVILAIAGVQCFLATRQDA